MVCYGLLFVMWCEPATAAAPKVVCPPVPAWSIELQRQAADELAAMPKNAAVRKMMRQHLQWRDRMRKVCQAPTR